MPEPHLLHVGKKAPKGWREIPGLSIHLGKGIWLLRCEPEPAPLKPGDELHTTPIFRTGKP